jgi:hypothetical protein
MTKSYKRYNNTPVLICQYIRNTFRNVHSLRIIFPPSHTAPVNQSGKPCPVASPMGDVETPSRSGAAPGSATKQRLRESVREVLPCSIAYGRHGNARSIRPHPRFRHHTPPPRISLGKPCPVAEYGSAPPNHLWGSWPAKRPYRPQTARGRTQSR